MALTTSRRWLTPLWASRYPTAITGADSTGIRVEKDYVDPSFLVWLWRIGTIMQPDSRGGLKSSMRYRGAGNTRRDRGGYRGSLSSSTRMRPHQRFIVVPYASFPRFPRSLDGEKNQGIIIVALSARTIQRSFGVMLQEHDAGTQRCWTRQQSWIQCTGGAPPRFYLFKYSNGRFVFLPLSCDKHKWIISIPS